MGDEDVVVDLLSADDIVAVAVDLVIGDFVVELSRCHSTLRQMSLVVAGPSGVLH